MLVFRKILHTYLIDGPIVNYTEAHQSASPHYEGEAGIVGIVFPRGRGANKIKACSFKVSNFS